MFLHLEPMVLTIKNLPASLDILSLVLTMAILLSSMLIISTAGIIFFYLVYAVSFTYIVRISDVYNLQIKIPESDVSFVIFMAD